MTDEADEDRKQVESAASSFFLKFVGLLLEV